MYISPDARTVFQQCQQCQQCQSNPQQEAVYRNYIIGCALESGGPATDFTQKTRKNTTLFDKHDTFRHFPPSTEQKHTKTRHFSTCPPFGHAETHKTTPIYDFSSVRPCKSMRNITISDTSLLRHHKNIANYNTSPHLPLRPNKNTQNHCYLRHFGFSTPQTHTKIGPKPYKNMTLYDT